MKQTEVERIAAEQERWRMKQAEFQRKLAAAQAEAVRAQGERERVLLAAKAEGDAGALAQLEAATEALAVAEREQRDCGSVLTQIESKLEALAREGHAAAIAANRSAYDDVVSKAVDAAGELETALERFGGAARIWRDCMQEAYSLNRAANLLDASLKLPVDHIFHAKLRGPIDRLLSRWLQWFGARAFDFYPPNFIEAFNSGQYRGTYPAVTRECFKLPRPESERGPAAAPVTEAA